ncbi:hypothetical protein [Kineococcus sp. NPDC059986]|uniref:hypothetical protein n=1 Tax=Kineococcus sp. NPDC059986 TaxID=3155538 RepID=UPI00344ED902
MRAASRPAATLSVLSRLLLVVAVTLGLSAMHVLAAAVSAGHEAVHDAGTAMSGPMPVSDHVAPVVPPHGMGAAHSPTQAGTHVQAPGTDHEHHHPMGDCVPFLSAGIALLLVLFAWAAARALRPSYRLSAPWLGMVIATTPWRGPPPWHWPRINLCVIRV